MKKIAVPNRLRNLLLEKIEGKKTMSVSTASVVALQDYIDHIANMIAEEAANSDYYKVSPLDIQRGIDKHELLVAKQLLDEQDTYIALKIEVEEKLKKMGYNPK
jgi:thymidylate kinase